jgi:hypothetical protein
MKVNIDALINEYTSTDELIPIKCLPKGIKGVVVMSPCIFMGPRGKPLCLYNTDMNLQRLEKIFNKALKDSNKEATIALLHYAVYNEKTFWQRYKDTELGTQVMAEILGQHE